MSSRVFTVFSRWKEIAFSITLRWCGADISSFKREHDENDVGVGVGVAGDGYDDSQPLAHRHVRYESHTEH